MRVYGFLTFEGFCFLGLRLSGWGVFWVAGCRVGFSDLLIYGFGFRDRGSCVRYSGFGVIVSVFNCVFLGKSYKSYKNYGKNLTTYLSK